MPLSWNEIGQRAITFARNWAGASRERAEVQSFWNDFFGMAQDQVTLFGTPEKATTDFTDFTDDL